MSGWVYDYLGDGATAIERFQKAMRLSPRDPLGYTFNSGLALAYLVDGKYEEALEWADLALAEQPKFSSSLRMKTAALAMLGRIDEANEVARALLAAEPDLTIERLTFLRWRQHQSAYMDGLRRAGIPER